MFEAAGAGACVITDAWKGIEVFFAVGSEIVLAESAKDVVEHLRSIDQRQARRMGDAMRRRALRDHQYAVRAAQVDELLRTRVAELALPGQPESGCNLVA